MKNMIIVNSFGLDNLSLSQLSCYTHSLFVAIEKIDLYFSNSLDGSYTFRHQIDPASTYARSEIETEVISSDDLDIKKEAVLFDFLGKARHALFAADFAIDSCVDDLLRYLTEIAIEADEVLCPQGQLFESKILNRVGLTQVIEKLTSIPAVGVSGLEFEIVCGKHTSLVKSLTKRKAVELLGGNFIDKNLYLGNFVVDKIQFENIEKLCTFLLDGYPVPVYITDKKWIKDFNLGKIALKKNDRLRAKAQIERSPLSKKLVYYFVEVEGINL